MKSTPFSDFETFKAALRTASKGERLVSCLVSNGTVYQRTDGTAVGFWQFRSPQNPERGFIYAEGE